MQIIVYVKLVGYHYALPHIFNIILGFTELKSVLLFFPDQVT